MKSYYELLRDNKCFRIIWIGEVINNCGGWFNYVATLTVVERLAGERGLLVSLVLIVRMLPSLLLFPVAGVAADRYSREMVLVVSNVAAACSVICFTFIQRPQDVWALYVLLFMQFSANSFYDPARRAITPTIVSSDKLPLATTLDSFAWSLVGAVGASLGGFAVSHVGPNICFVLDAVTYIIAAFCAFALKGMLTELKVKQESDVDVEALHLAAPQKATVELVPQPPKTTVSVALHGDAGELHSRGGGESSAAVIYADLEEGEDAETEHLIQARRADHSSASSSGAQATAKTADQGIWQAVTGGFTEELAALKEGAIYISAPKNRDAAAFALIKASGAIVWGASDILQVRFSNLPSMQSLGDSSTTLGLLFASIGLACFIGPVLSNRITPPRKPHLLRACAASFVLFFAGYLLMSVAPNIWALVPSTIVRSMGSSVVWVYSTLLIQLRVPNQLQGRMMALEMAAYVVAESMSAVLGGMAFDLIGLSVRSVALLMSGIAAVSAALWVWYAAYQWPKGDIVTEGSAAEEEEEGLLRRVSSTGQEAVAEARL
ncbi:g2061 [Coccomyxa elongata]